MKQVEREVRFFDDFVHRYGDSDVLAESAYVRLSRVFADLLAPRAGELCLDIGCGTGGFTRRLVALGLRVVGIDISPASVRRARERSGSAMYAIGDVTSAPFLSGSFDLVALNGVFHHFSTEDARLQLMRETFRLLRSGGRLFGCDPSAQSPAMRLYRDPRSPLFSSAGKTPNEVLLGRSELARGLARAGFVDVRVRGQSGLAFHFVGDGPIKLLLPIYNVVYEGLLHRSPLEDRFGTFLVTSAVKP